MIQTPPLLLMSPYLPLRWWMRGFRIRSRVRRDKTYSLNVLMGNSSIHSYSRKHRSNYIQMTCSRQAENLSTLSCGYPALKLWTSRSLSSLFRTQALRNGAGEPFSLSTSGGLSYPHSVAGPYWKMIYFQVKFTYWLKKRWNALILLLRQR